MKSREAIRKEINVQLETPRLIVRETSHERSEHFGQIKVDVFGEIEIKNYGPYNFLMEIEPDDLRTALEEFFETTMYIRDPDLNFGTEVGVKVKSMKFLFSRYDQVHILGIKYTWKEL